MDFIKAALFVSMILLMTIGVILTRIESDLAAILHILQGMKP